MVTLAYPRIHDSRALPQALLLFGLFLFRGPFGLLLGGLFLGRFLFGGPLGLLLGGLLLCLFLLCHRVWLLP